MYKAMFILAVLLVCLLPGRVYAGADNKRCDTLTVTHAVTIPVYPATTQMKVKGCAVRPGQHLLGEGFEAEVVNVKGQTLTVRHVAGTEGTTLVHRDALLEVL
jgi:hypothetical protein